MSNLCYSSLLRLLHFVRNDSFRFLIFYKIFLFLSFCISFHKFGVLFGGVDAVAGVFDFAD